MKEMTLEPNVQSKDVLTLKSHYGHYINGKHVTVDGAKKIDVINPSNEELIATIEQASDDLVEEAVRAAKSALKPWRKLPSYERARFIYKIGKELQRRTVEFATLESMDNGKPISETKNVDVPLAAQHFIYYAGWADKLEYAFPGTKPKPVGVVGQIIPWNFPLLMLAWKLAPALAGGNTIVLKPASNTPMTAMLLTEIFDEIGLPPGVVNIVNGGGSSTGTAIVRNPMIKKVAFTGSTGVGSIIQRELAGSTKRLTLELGGKGANIVFDDADIDQAIEGVIRAIYFNQGEVCCAGSRLLLHEPIAKDFIGRLQERVAKMKVGDPLDYNTNVGAINSPDQYNKIKEMIDKGIEEGATINQEKCDLPEKGYFIPPTFFTDVTPDQTIAREEIFGPVLAVLTFHTPEEALKIANDTNYGLGNGVWSGNPERILQFSRGLQSGVVWANAYNCFDATSPFGGYKESGFGREGGIQGLFPYLKLI